MPYSVVEDLLLGDLLVSTRVDKGKFVTEAAEEIDSKIGFLYVLPLEPTGEAETLPLHQLLLLKGINNKLASGRLILTLDIAGEGTALHAYGLRLITEALTDLMLIANGAVDLDAVRLPDATLPDEPFGARSPSITNVDAISAVDAFYEWARPSTLPVEYPLSPVWSPGA